MADLVARNPPERRTRGSLNSVTTIKQFDQRRDALRSDKAERFSLKDEWKREERKPSFNRESDAGKSIVETTRNRCIRSERNGPRAVE